jgi:predicted restriction endonuclease
MPFSKKVFKQLETAERDECCEMCGFKLPLLYSRGLIAAHIIAKQDGGKDHIDNALVLCRNCAEAFDTLLKPKIYKAFTLHGLKAPASWEFAEGRGSPDDSV